MRSREIEDYKKGLHLSSIQRSILVGLLLGDGHLEAQNGGKTYRLKVEHSVQQKDYVDWLYNQFKDWVRTGPKLRKEGKSYGFTTYSHSSFRFYGQQFYKSKLKVIPKIIGKLLTPLSLAIWFMDDGSLKSKKHQTYNIHTLGYTKHDLIVVTEALKKKFGLNSALHKQKTKFLRIYIPSKSAKKFREIVSPYILLGIEYKLGNIKPKK